MTILMNLDAFSISLSVKMKKDKYYVTFSSLDS